MNKVAGDSRGDDRLDTLTWEVQLRKLSVDGEVLEMQVRVNKEGASRSCPAHIQE